MKHVPKSLVEQHYHIQDLIDRQEKRTEDLNRYRDIEKLRNERLDEISQAKTVDIKPFWCVTCSKDFNALTFKQTDGWSESAFYKAKHKPCGTWCMRLITDNWKDAYWTKSRNVAIDQGRHHNDTIQPHETGFNLLYGKK